MTAYKCTHGHVFFEDEMKREYYPEGEGMRYRYLCPMCGTDEFEEAFPCDTCGYFFTDEELQYGLCEECRENVDDKVTAMNRGFSECERAYARAKYDEGEGVFA